MKRLPVESIKECLDIDFGSTGDDNFEPRCMCSRIGQNLQDGSASPSVTTLVKCINDKDKSIFRVARKGADEIKEERPLHRPWCQIWIMAKTVCHNASKRGED